MSMPVYAPYVQTYAQHQPYVTIDEFVAAPNGINLSEIVPQTDDATNRAALAEVLAEASSEADRICHQVLAASRETWSGWVRVQNDNTLIVVVPFTPIVAVLGYTYASDPASPVTASDLHGVSIESTNTVKLPVNAYPGGGRQYITLSYVSGFHNSFLTAAPVAGASAITVDNTLGVAPGMQLTINDPINGQNEIVVVASTTATSITLTGVTQYGHPVGARISAMPPAIKRAVLMLAQAAIRSKLTQTIVIPGAGGAQPAVTTTVGAQAMKDHGDAVDILHEYARYV